MNKKERYNEHVVANEKIQIIDSLFLSNHYLNYDHEIAFWNRKPFIISEIMGFDNEKNTIYALKRLFIIGLF